MLWRCNAKDEFQAAINLDGKLAFDPIWEGVDFDEVEAPDNVIFFTVKEWKQAMKASKESDEESGLSNVSEYYVLEIDL